MFIPVSIEEAGLLLIAFPEARTAFMKEQALQEQKKKGDKNKTKV